MSCQFKIPKPTKEFIEELQTHVFSHEKYDNYRHLFRHLKGDFNYKCCQFAKANSWKEGWEPDCNKDVVWWFPVMSIAWCDKHIDDKWRKELTTYWSQTRLELIYVRLSKHYNLRGL